MKKVKLYFKIVLPYRREWYGQLRDAGGFYVITKTGKVLWEFPLSSLPKVIEAIAEPIEIDEEDAEIALKYSKYVTEIAKLKRYKGEGRLEITETGKMYVIRTVIGKKVQEFNIPKELVAKVWSAIMEFPLNEKIASRTVAHKICLKLGLKKFFKDGKFNWEEFFGTRRAYYRYFYLPIKVLEQKKLVIHNKQGYVIRVADRGLDEKSRNQRAHGSSVA